MRREVFFADFLSVILGHMSFFGVHSIHDPLLCFVECHIPSRLPYRSLGRSWVDHVGIDWVGWMEALALCLIKRHEKELRTIPDALHLRCYILVPICKSVNPIVQKESLIVE